MTTEMCKYCENKNNFADVGVKDMHGKYHVYLACGSSDVPESDRFDFCPKCGTPLGEVKPLTVEQLRERVGKPYYHVSLQGNGDKWSILESHIARCPQDYHYGKYWLAFD